MENINIQIQESQQDKYKENHTKPYHCQVTKDPIKIFLKY